jgi:hypothetical protein
MRQLGLGLLLLTAPAAQAGDRQDMERKPASCRQLYTWQERCRLGPCNATKIEYWRERCKADSVHK